MLNEMVKAKIEDVWYPTNRTAISITGVGADTIKKLTTKRKDLNLWIASFYVDVEVDIEGTETQPVTLTFRTAAGSDTYETNHVVQGKGKQRRTWLAGVSSETDFDQVVLQILSDNKILDERKYPTSSASE